LKDPALSNSLAVLLRSMNVLQARDRDDDPGTSELAFRNMSVVFVDRLATLDVRLCALQKLSAVAGFVRGLNDVITEHVPKALATGSDRLWVCVNWLTDVPQLPRMVSVLLLRINQKVIHHWTRSGSQWHRNGSMPYPLVNCPDGTGFDLRPASGLLQHAVDILNTDIKYIGDWLWYQCREELGWNMQRLPDPPRFTYGGRELSMDTLTPAFVLLAVCICETLNQASVHAHRRMRPAPHGCGT